MAPDAPAAPMPEIATAPASELMVESSDAVTLSLAPALMSAPALLLVTLEILAVTLLRTQLSATEPAPAIASAPPPLTAMAAICASRPLGRLVGLAKVASTVRLPVLASTAESSMSADTLSCTLLTAKAKPTPALPPNEALMLPASVAMDAVSLASTETLFCANTSESSTMLLATVLLIRLTASEPPNALPPPEAAPPTTTLMMRADSSALTVTEPSAADTFAADTCAMTEFLMSFTPTEAFTATPCPSVMASAPVPEYACEMSRAMTTMSPVAAVTARFRLTGSDVEMYEDTFMRTKFSDKAPAPEPVLPPAPATVTLVICAPTVDGRAMARPAELIWLFLTTRLWPVPVPVDVSVMALAAVAVASA